MTTALAQGAVCRNFGVLMARGAACGDLEAMAGRGAKNADPGMTAARAWGAMCRALGVTAALLQGRGCGVMMARGAVHGGPRGDDCPGMG